MITFWLDLYKPFSEFQNIIQRKRFCYDLSSRHNSLDLSVFLEEPRFVWQIVWVSCLNRKKYWYIMILSFPSLVAISRTLAFWCLYYLEGFPFLSSGHILTRRWSWTKWKLSLFRAWVSTISLLHLPFIFRIHTKVLKPNPTHYVSNETNSAIGLNRPYQCYSRDPPVTLAGCLVKTDVRVCSILYAA